MSLGFAIGGADTGTSVLCLHTRPRECEIDVAKSKPMKVDEDTRMSVLIRGNYHCERCGSDFMTLGVSVHHRRPRMMGGSKNADLHRPANLIALCGSGVSGCHGWVESNRQKARREGLLIQKVESAEEIPFKDSKDRWWLLDNLGQKRQLDTNWTMPDV